jgi:prolyl-tRNA editing enzyme YbaK/EbsC (Cys-tRNA(Pro) deacylase)
LLTEKSKDFHKISYEIIPKDGIENFYKTILLTDKVKEKVKKFVSQKKAFAVILKSTSRLNLKNFKKYLKTTSKVSEIQEKDFQENFDGINAILLNELEIPIIFDKH